MKIFRYICITALILLFGCSSASINSPEDNTQMNVSHEDLNQIIQLILDIPDLQEYFHPAIPERMHLKVVREPSFPDELAISKFGNPVKYLEREDISGEDENYVAFSKINVEDKQALVEFIYPIEGVVGSVYLSKKDNAWIIQETNLAEHIVLGILTSDLLAIPQ